jgi:hypothetical protein
VRKVEYNGKQCDAIPMDFDTEIGEKWAQHKTTDGSVIRLKFEVIEIMKVVGEYQPNGEPVYLFTHTTQLVTRAPDELQKHVQDKKKLQ